MLYLDSDINLPKPRKFKKFKKISGEFRISIKSFCLGQTIFWKIREVVNKVIKYFLNKSFSKGSHKQTPPFGYVLRAVA